MIRFGPLIQVWYFRQTFTEFGKILPGRPIALHHPPGDAVAGMAKADRFGLPRAFWVETLHPVTFLTF